MSSSVTDVSAVICVRNSAETLVDSIGALKKQSIPEQQIIVVDGESNDESVSIASNLGCKVLSDNGKGFTFARALGTSLVVTDFTLVLGPDDVLDDGAILKMLNYLDSHPRCAGVQLSKKVEPKSPTFFDYGMSLYYSKLPVGNVPVIGTPSIFRTSLLQSEAYDARLANDDTDWCFRISDLGYYFYRLSGTFANEISSLSWVQFFNRWTWYGRGDYDFIRKHLRISKRRALRHLFHPAREYILRLALGELVRGNLPGSWYFLLCGSLRYLGMLRSIRRIKHA